MKAPAVHRIVILLALGWLAGGGPVAAGGTGEGNGVHPLADFSPGLPAEDFAPAFDAIVGDAPIVALGEIVHGNRGLMELELRLVQYLVEQRGFRTVVIENAVMRTEGLGEWVREAAGDHPAPIDLLTHPYVENLRLATWLRDYNRAHPDDPVHLQGMDIWDRPWEQQARMELLARRLGLPFEQRLALTREHCWMHAAADWAPMLRYDEILKQEHRIPPEDFIPGTQALESMRRETLAALARAPDKPRADYCALLRALNSSLAWQAYKNFRAANDMARAQSDPAYADSDFARAMNARDLAQARNLAATWEEFGHAKMIVIGHTTHLTRMSEPASWLNLAPGALRSAVMNLRELAGPGKVRTFALTGYELGSAGTLPATGTLQLPDSFEGALHRAGHRAAFVDPRGAWSRTREEWTFQWKGGESVRLRLDQHFDGYFFVDSAPEGTRLESTRGMVQW